MLTPHRPGLSVKTSPSFGTAFRFPAFDALPAMDPFPREVTDDRGPTNEACSSLQEVRFDHVHATHLHVAAIVAVAPGLVAASSNLPTARPLALSAHKRRLVPLVDPNLRWRAACESSGTLRP